MTFMWPSHRREDQHPLLGEEKVEEGKMDTSNLNLNQDSKMHAEYNHQASRSETPPAHTFIPAIEGLRGIAVTLAMYCHIEDGLETMREVAGSMGVTIFFVLSGFLITAVLMRLDAKKTYRYSYVARFYADRFFRLGPGMIFMVLLASSVHWYRGYNMDTVTRYAILTLTYTSNISTFWTEGTGPFGNTWSLACEEQYYIMWSLLLPLILARSKRVKTIIMLSLVVSFMGMQATIGMFDLWQLNWRFSLWSNVWKMLLGASLRLVTIPSWIEKSITSYLGLFGLASILLLSTQDQPDYGRIAEGWKDAIRPTLFWGDILSGICTSLILCSVSAPEGGNAILELSLLRFLGRVSYSWYLWQIPILMLTGWQRGWAGYSTTAVAFCLAMFSTIYIEEPINQAWKQYKSRRDHRRIAASSPTPESLA